MLVPRRVHSVRKATTSAWKIEEKFCPNLAEEDCSTDPDLRCHNLARSLRSNSSHRSSVGFQSGLWEGHRSTILLQQESLSKLLSECRQHGIT
ncbi:hypothetical protein TNIN_79441 [Trichonephila inaurata madagascariensis]|uniref:Uncharacterized protein n=1 Tax=Trichonephila inaurata madagascariensis TaxID=2747483 RepID=A0A8X6MLI8_9ARAC|nr:hypothetical protein TNIN_79441 [Trichonephila inaurata madagascariensis]